MIDELREIANRVNELRHERIGRSNATFNASPTEVSQLLLDVAPAFRIRTAECGARIGTTAVDSMKGVRARDLHGRKK